MSDVETRPPEYASGPAPTTGPEEVLLESRKVWLSRTTQVSRALPNADSRMIGAWCFLDHYGPEDVSTSPGVRVWAHPHTGLQTVSWLLGGELFAEEIVMWWNVVGRSHAEVVGYRNAWVRRDPRFARVVSADEKVMGAPPMPTVRPRPRPRPRPRRWTGR